MSIYKAHQLGTGHKEKAFSGSSMFMLCINIYDGPKKVRYILLLDI